MYLVNLKKELVKLRYVFKFCPSYCYFTHNFIFQSYKKYLVQFRFAETFNIYFTTLKINVNKAKRLATKIDRKPFRGVNMNESNYQFYVVI